MVSEREEGNEKRGEGGRERGGKANIYFLFL
jgi:hypothetical protein